MLSVVHRLKGALGFSQMRGDSDGRLEVTFGGNFVPQASVDLGSTLETFYTCPNGKKAKLWVEFTNNDNTAAVREVTFNLVPAGGSAGSENEVLDSVPIPPNSIGIRLGPYGLPAGMVARGFADSANTVTVHIFVEEFDA